MMKTLIYMFFITMPLFSCKVQMVEKTPLSGTFYKLEKGTDFDIAYTLELKPDKSFKLIVNSAGGTPQCEGKWRIKDDEIIVLECYKDESPIETITNAYMSQKTHEVKVINKNRLKYNDVVLRRKR